MLYIGNSFVVAVVVEVEVAGDVAGDGAGLPNKSARTSLAGDVDGADEVTPVVVGAVGVADDALLPAGRWKRTSRMFPPSDAGLVVVAVEAAVAGDVGVEAEVAEVDVVGVVVSASSNCLSSAGGGIRSRTSSRTDV